MGNMLKDPLLKESIEKIMIQDSSQIKSNISGFDNTLILIGKFK
jgi:hypothetical protein